MKAMWYGFLAGLMAMNSIHGITQDVMGKEKFIQYASDYWVSAFISTPISIAGLVMALVLLSISYRHIKKMMTRIDDLIRYNRQRAFEEGL